MNNFYVIGSINMDLIMQLDHFPIPGETIIAKKLTSLPGGKGANQAVALSRLQNANESSASVHIFGKIGNDQWGKSYQAIFNSENINTEYIETIDNIPTGTAFIEVDSSSQNRIVVVPGANSYIDKHYIDKCLAIIQHSATKLKASENIFVLLQLEIPLESVCYTLMQLHSFPNIITILDPAPAQEIPLEYYKYIDFITPNESEASLLTGITIRNEHDIKMAGEILLRRGTQQVIIKAGKSGAYYFDKSSKSVPENSNYGYGPAIKGIKAIDTTAAGDSFNAGFAYGLHKNNTIEEAIHFANIVAGLSTTKHGAQSAMPTLKEISQVDTH